MLLRGYDGRRRYTYRHEGQAVFCALVFATGVFLGIGIALLLVLTGAI